MTGNNDKYLFIFEIGKMASEKKQRSVCDFLSLSIYQIVISKKHILETKGDEKIDADLGNYA